MQTQIIGEALIQGMTFDYKFTKKEIAITIKPMLLSILEILWWRLIFSCSSKEYLFSTRPSSLFEKKFLMNEAYEPTLKNALINQPGLSECNIPDTSYVFDGGSWLQRLPWTIRSMFDKLCQSFKNCLLNNCGAAENITIIFDGYLGPSLKDSTYLHHMIHKFETRVQVNKVIRDQ